MKAESPKFRAAVADVTHRLERMKGVNHIDSPYVQGGGGAVSPDHHSALLSFSIKGDALDPGPAAAIDKSVLSIKAVGKDHPGMRVEQFGDGSSEKEFQKLVKGDLQKAEVTSLPLTLIVLLLTFGSLLVAGMPVLLAITGVVATFGLIGPLSQISPVESSIKNVVLLIGLAVGVDYSLFYLKRVREEHAAGRTKEAAIDAAAATSGHAVLVSGLTVMTAMAGMYLAGSVQFTAWATGTVVVVAVAMIGSLTVLPALLSAMGGKVHRRRTRGLSRIKNRIAAFGFWSRVTNRVMRRPLLWASLSAGLLVALAIPALSMHTGEPGTDTLPKDIPIVQTFKRLQVAFPSKTSGLSLVVKAGNVNSAAVKAGVAKFERALKAQPKVFPNAGLSIDVNPAKTVETIEFAIAGDGNNKASEHALEVVRSDVVPATLGAVPGVDAYATSGPAQAYDFNKSLKSHILLVFGFVLMAAFLLLMFTFRSIVIPIKAIILNLLSVAASYGALVLVFQHGWGKSLLGFDKTGPIVPWLPLFLFVILFGLSMDYHVFILSRVREARDKGMKTEDAVGHAMRNTAGTVTSAALVMVGVFAVFATLSFMMFKQMGVGLAFAVLLDATIIRGVLLPASMKLLGEWNWWLPKSLSWLPKRRHEPEPVGAGA
jgi:RND superfamily putative drug exporter